MSARVDAASPSPSPRASRPRSRTPRTPRTPRKRSAQSRAPPPASSSSPPPPPPVLSSSSSSPPRTVQTLRAHDTKLVALLWSPSGRYLAAAAQRGLVKIFYVLPGRQGAVRVAPMRTLCGHAGDVLGMAFSPTDFLLTASMDHSVRLWHADTNLCLRRFAHPDMVTAVAFHPADENFVVSGGCDGVVRIWKPAEHACVADTNVGAVVTAAQFSADGRAAFVGTYDGHLFVLDTSSLLRPPSSSPPHNSARAALTPPLGSAATATATAADAAADAAAADAAADAAAAAVTAAFGTASSSADSASTSPTLSPDMDAHTSPCASPTPLLQVRSTLSIRARRARRKVPGPRVCGVAIDAARDEIVVTGSDARLHVLSDAPPSSLSLPSSSSSSSSSSSTAAAGADVVSRVRVAGSRRADAGAVRLGTSVSHDGRYLLLECSGDELRMVDLHRARGLEGATRRKERDLVVPADTLEVGKGVQVSCAAFATQGAWRNARAGDAKDCGFLVAVGADDGTLHVMVGGG